jgi:hypothetical protein
MPLAQRRKSRMGVSAATQDIGGRGADSLATSPASQRRKHTWVYKAVKL